MAGRRIYTQLFVRRSASFPADERRRAVVLIIIFCNFIGLQLRADDFQIPPHRKAAVVQSSPFGRPSYNCGFAKFRKNPRFVPFFFGTSQSLSALAATAMTNSADT